MLQVALDYNHREQTLHTRSIRKCQQCFALMKAASLPANQVVCLKSEQRKGQTEPAMQRLQAADRLGSYVVETAMH